MIHLIVQLSKYLMMILFMVYTFECFHVFKFKGNFQKQLDIYNRQRKLMYIIHFDGFFVLLITTGNFNLIGLYLMQIVLFVGIYMVYHMFYKNASELVLNNMCMLLSIGMIILTRLSYEKAMRQFLFITAGSCIAMIIPLILSKMSLFRKLKWLYAALGIVALLYVLIAKYSPLTSFLQ